MIKNLQANKSPGPDASLVTSSKHSINNGKKISMDVLPKKVYRSPSGTGSVPHITLIRDVRSEPRRAPPRHLSEWPPSMTQGRGAGEDAEGRGPRALLAACKSVQPPWETTWSFLARLKLELPAIPRLGVDRKEMKMPTGKDTRPPRPPRHHSRQPRRGNHRRTVDG